MTYHLHIGFLQLFVIFVGAVLLMGTAWRLVALHLSHSDNPFLQQLGAAMAFMY